VRSPRAFHNEQYSESHNDTSLTAFLPGAFLVAADFALAAGLRLQAISVTAEHNLLPKANRVQKSVTIYK
jgi:hypothetical protein